MRCLWLTRKYPRPVNSGELIYSDGMIGSFAATDVSLTVIAHDNEESPVGDGSENSRFTDDQGVNWRLGTPRLGGRLKSLATGLPSDSYRLKNGGPSDALSQALTEEKWDAVVIDHAAMGWALEKLVSGRNGSRLPKLVYLSHNHEAKIRREIAKHSTEESLPKQLALKWDAEKYAKQEEALCEKVDLVTAITDSEVDAYRDKFSRQRYLTLTPGYAGKRFPDHEISDQTPRRVVMSGSFEWIAKRLNLESFLTSAAQSFADAGVELQIVGKTEESFRESISARFPTVDFVGRVPEMSPYLLDARMGLIVETLGGGFKLKALDYLYHRLPLAGLTHAVDGLPHESPEEILLMRTMPSLVREILAAVDDVPRLNRMSEASYRKCETTFEWKDRGRQLYEAIRDL
ncbi:MAG: glycosyltransferase [Verrucomicrobiae bacterium]|nr:glycosyltransferase [Verrucomicrobiae bacterium]